ncbi:MAG: T9SS type A sorting domain-containing protein [Bacteroidota bacterium]
MKKVIFTLSLLLGFLASTAFTQDTTVVSGTTGTATWTKDKVWVLDGYVRVDNGEVLTIEAGTVVLAETGSQENASALIIERNGIILANGTEAEPIIFSSVLDDVNDPADFLDDQRKGLWGGIIMCGDAPTNTNENGTEQVEGIPSTLPSTVGTFGGNVADDSSGVMTYVSIRHTGVALASNNEIQGLTLAGVGSKTVLDYIESYASDDDGIEIFGGTVSMKHVVVAFAADDMFDLDQGWTGNVQYLFIIQSADFGDRLGEWDGADTPEDGMPFGSPTIFNMTMIGSNPAGTNNRTITFRANGGGKVYNSVFYEQGRGIDVEMKSDALVSESSYDRFQAGDLVVSNNVFWNVAGNTAADLYKVSPIAAGWVDSAATVSAAVTDVLNTMSAANVIADPVIAGLSYIADGQLDPRFSGSDVSTDLATVPNSWFTPTHYKGAFPPNKGSFWAANWTALDHYGYFNKDLTTGINDRLLLEGVRVYPNPNLGTFAVKAGQLTEEAVNISVFDMTGRRISIQKVRPVAGQIEAEVNIETAAAGMYFVKVQQGSRLSTSQIVKN